VGVTCWSAAGGAGGRAGVKEWFEAYLTNDLARAKELYVPSKREQAERDLQQLKRLLEVVSGW